MTNRKAFRLSPFPLCEWHPEERRPAWLSDPYHATATRIVSADHHGGRLLMCEACANSMSPAIRRTVETFGGGVEVDGRYVLPALLEMLAAVTRARCAE